MQQSQAVGVFGRHLVAVVLKADNCNGIWVLTTFVASLNDQWYLITAGHVLEGLAAERAERGVTSVKARLLDLSGLDPKFQMGIPFEYDSATPVVVGNDASYDYAAIPLAELYRRQLETNKIVPLDEQVWVTRPVDPDSFVLAGFPGQLVEPNKDESQWEQLGLSCTIHTLEPLDSAPHGFKEKTGPRTYFRIALGDVLNDPKGMSGGPVFALKVGPPIKYWLVGVQSSWYAPSRSIAVCPAALFLDYLRTDVKG